MVKYDSERIGLWPFIAGAVIAVLLNLWWQTVIAQEPVTQAPTLTETQRLQIQVLSLRLENAQMKLQMLQVDFEKTRVGFEHTRAEFTTLLQSLQVDGYTLNVQDFTYTKNVVPKEM